jgi:hypothetical protein
MVEFRSSLRPVNTSRPFAAARSESDAQQPESGSNPAPVLADPKCVCAWLDLFGFRKCRNLDHTLSAKSLFLPEKN